MRSEEKDYFNAIAGRFDAKYNVYSRPAGIARVRRRVGLFAELCDLRSGQRILEIGCGTGEYSRALRSRGLNLFATDVSIHMILQARGKMGEGRNPLFFVSDVERLPFPSSCFDIILGNSILHHLSVEKAMDEIGRVLKPGGRFVFSEPNMCNPQIFLQKKIVPLKKLLGDSAGETAFFRRPLRSTLEKAGFRNVAVTPFDFLHPHTPAVFVTMVDAAGRFMEKTPLKEIAGSLLITGQK